MRLIPGTAVLLLMLGCQPAIPQDTPEARRPAGQRHAGPNSSTITGKVVNAADGDTLVIGANKAEHRIRLYGIDCPEGSQPFGSKAWQFTDNAAAGKHVRVEVRDRDRYGRLVGVVTLRDGSVLNHELVRAGLAWHYIKYAPDDQKLADLEASARAARRGLWAAENPIPPWEWRARDTQLLPSSVEVTGNGIRIIGLLPNPEGRDEGHERILLENDTDKPIDLAGWRLQDAAGNVFALDGRLPAGWEREFLLTPPSMPLNNDGDEILLLDAQGKLRSRVKYGEQDVRPGEWISFESEKDADASPSDGSEPRLDDLDGDAASILQAAPEVAQVVTNGPAGRPSQRIIHLLDWHYVPHDMLVVDMRANADTPLSDDQIAESWAQHLRDVQAVQDEQMVLLEWLVRRHGLRRIYFEGLTEDDMPIFMAKIQAMQKVQAELDELREHVEVSEALQEQFQALEQQFQQDLLRIGAAGRLLMAGKIEAVAPLEDTEAYEAASPVAADGKIVLDHEKIETREDAQAKRALAGGVCVVVVLGGAHDLSDNLDRLAGGQVEYLRVATKAWQDISHGMSAEAEQE